MNNFFDAVGLLDKEILHTQVLYWIFNDNNLSNQAKAEFLNSIIGEEGSQVYLGYKCYTEYPIKTGKGTHDSIDLIVEVDNPPKLVIFENKLKSSQHNDQLSRYIESIQKDVRFKSYKDKTVFVYLTLIDEEACCDGWINTDYSRILKAIENLRFSKDSYNIILNEYKESLRELLKVTESFIEDHKAYSNVFTDCKLSKLQKASKMENYTPLQKYIARNQLETILLKLFLRKVSLNMNISEAYQWEIADTHGAALLQIDLCKFVTNSGREYTFGIQYQGDAIKVNIASTNYGMSKINDYKQDREELKIKKVVEEVKRFDYKKENLGKSKAYCSYSKRVDKSFWSKDINEITRFFKVEYENAIAISNALQLLS